MPGKILLVNDSAAQRALYKELLQNAGYAVIESDNGLQGLEKARRENPDVVVTDLSMPQMSGLELAKALKSSAETRYIPVVCISATFQDLSTKLSALLEAGAEEYFYAEQSNEELLAKLVVMMRIRKVYLELLEKNRQLEVFAEAATGRELKMVELKEQIRKLEEELLKKSR